MNRNTAISVVVALIVVCGGFLLFTNQTVPVLEENLTGTPPGKAGMVPYQNPEYSLSFEYPSNLYLHERADAGTPERPQLSLFLVEDTQENRDVLEGRNTVPREGPIGITVDVYQNPQELTSDEWVRTDTNWTVANSTADPITVAGRDAVTFTWSGLYEGKTVVVTSGDRAYVFSVTWMSPEDQILKDFEMVLNSFDVI